MRESALYLAEHMHEVPVHVIYPPQAERVSHFRVVADPTRIVLRLVHTALTVRRTTKAP